MSASLGHKKLLGSRVNDPDEPQRAPAGAGAKGISKKRKSPEPMQARQEALKRSIDDTRWEQPEISEGSANQRWPHRKRVAWEEEAFKAGAAAFKLKQQSGILGEYTGTPAVAHFKAIDLEEEDGTVLHIQLGDFVEINLSQEDEHFAIMEVNELFEDLHGDRFFAGHWFYKMQDTALAVNGKNLWDAIDRRRIYRASAHDNAKGYTLTHPFAAVDRKVVVHHVVPGSQPPAGGDYWWEMEHDRRFLQFVDRYPSDAVGVQAAVDSQAPRVLLCADFYSGCGGLSFMDQQTPDVHVDTKWAVDFSESMTLSFRANYPDTHVYKMGVDEWLQMCRLFEALVIKYGRGLPDGQQAKAKKGGKSPQKPLKMAAAKVGGKTKEPTKAAKAQAPEPCKPKSAAEGIYGVRLGDSAERGTKGQTKGCLQEALTRQNSWLEVSVKRHGHEADWERLDTADLPDDMLAAFVQETRATKAVPIPGDIDVVMGGPPCQGVSGLNRHSAMVNILQDGRNRQVTAFYRVVEHFQPAFVLMENVVDTLRKEDGMYAKSAMASLLAMRYQVRTGIIAACDFGVPQSRNRVFMWGAKSGAEQLPPFPQPTHRGIRNSVPVEHKDSCMVDFPNSAAKEAAYPMMTLGDILSDLPSVTNFTFAERQQYASAAQTPAQLWLQRPPKPWQATAEERAQRAEAFMHASHAELEQRITGKSADAETVGRKFSCSSNNRGHVKYAHDHYLAELENEEERQMALVCRKAAQKALFHQTGVEVLKQFQVAREATGRIRDHRPLCLNLDDHARVCHIPKAKKANFRGLDGVVTHADGLCCAGHWHAHITQGSGRSSCPGGGHWVKPAKTNQKETRVDHANDDKTCPGTHLPGCPARTVWMPSGGLLCPRWCITYKEGKSSGRHGCYGRAWYDEVQPTVVGRAEPHNLALIHPGQNRVLTIRENARCQGFPDYFALVGLSTKGSSSWVRNPSLTDRYQQMGNAVCPMVASALGRCLVLAAAGAAPSNVEQAVVSVPDPDYVLCMAEARRLGLQFYVEECGGISAAAAVAGGQAAGGIADEEEDNLPDEEGDADLQ